MGIAGNYIVADLGTGDTIHRNPHLVTGKGVAIGQQADKVVFKNNVVCIYLNPWAETEVDN